MKIHLLLVAALSTFAITSCAPSSARQNNIQAVTDDGAASWWLVKDAIDYSVGAWGAKTCADVDLKFDEGLDLKLKGLKYVIGLQNSRSSANYYDNSETADKYYTEGDIKLLGRASELSCKESARKIYTSVAGRKMSVEDARKVEALWRVLR